MVRLSSEALAAAGPRLARPRTGLVDRQGPAGGFSESLRLPICGDLNRLLPEQALVIQEDDLMPSGSDPGGP